MNVSHIQVPKSKDRSIRQALEQIRADFDHVPQLQVIEYEQLYIIDGLDSDATRIALSDALNKLDILHF